MPSVASARRRRRGCLLRASHHDPAGGGLIPINASASAPAIMISLKGQEIFMTYDTMLVSVAVVSVFIAFAGVLLWGDFQTRPAQLTPQKRRR
jgi:hypothetical protein